MTHSQYVYRAIPVNSGLKFALVHMERSEALVSTIKPRKGEQVKKPLSAGYTVIGAVFSNAVSVMPPGMSSNRTNDFWFATLAESYCLCKHFWLHSIREWTDNASIPSVATHHRTVALGLHALNDLSALAVNPLHNAKKSPTSARLNKQGES